MHAGEHRSADEGNLVDDQEHHVLQRIFQLSQRGAFELVLPCSVREYLERRARSPSAKTNVEGRYAGVRSELHFSCQMFLLEHESHVLHARPQRPGLPTASRSS